MKGLSFLQLVNIAGDLYNELHYQLKPISDEMEKKFLEMKRQEQILQETS